MQKLVTYQDLDVWKIAMKLAESVYEKTNKYPDSERFGLISQMRRAAVSIPSNIAEGYRRKGRGEYIKFLSYAYGSASELETQIESSRRLTFLDRDDHEQLFSLVQLFLKKINSLLYSLKSV